MIHFNTSRVFLRGEIVKKSQYFLITVILSVIQDICVRALNGMIHIFVLIKTNMSQTTSSRNSSFKAMFMVQLFSVEEILRKNVKWIQLLNTETRLLLLFFVCLYTCIVLHSFQ